MNKTTQQLQAEIEANQAEIKRRNEIENAWAQGKKIECIPLQNREQETWFEEVPKWYWNALDYRVKPEPVKPRRCCAQFFNGRWGEAYHDINMAKFTSTQPLIPLVELTPEVRAALEEKKLL
jgi:hypothetical protein